MNKPTILYIVAVSLIFIGMMFVCSNKPPAASQNIQCTLDSLNDEILGLSIEKGRYEIILNQLWEADSNFVIEHTKYIE
jgi:hypothetical protein